jgi:hypothetical protein
MKGKVRFHIYAISFLALAHFLTWIVVLYQEIGRAIGSMWASRVTGHSDYGPSPLYTVFSFPVILLPDSWLVGLPGITLAVVNSFLWGIALDALFSLIWRGVQSLIHRKRPAVQQAEE